MIEVPSFSFSPHITAMDFPGTLSRATLLCTNREQCKCSIADSIEFNGVVERAIKIRRGEMLNAVLVILPELEDAVKAKGGPLLNDQQKSAVMRGVRSVQLRYSGALRFCG